MCGNSGDATHVPSVEEGEDGPEAEGDSSARMPRGSRGEAERTWAVPHAREVESGQENREAKEAGGTGDGEAMALIGDKHAGGRKQR